MNEQMMKSLVDLIDESLAEIEELKKSDRFSPSEIKIEGPGSGIAGKPVNGSLDKDEDKDDDDDDDDDDDKDDAKKTEGAMDKGEGNLRQADPNGGRHKIAKADKTGMPEGTAKSDIEKAQDAVDKAEADMTAAKADMEKAEGRNRYSDPNGAKHKVVKADDDDGDDEDKDNDKGGHGYKDKDDKGRDAKANKFMKKTAEESNTLLKSYVDERLAPIEGKLEAIMTLVKQVADAPAPAKGSSYRNVEPLKKSDDSEAPSLTKSALVDKLLDLKKSGSRVDSVDVASAELGGPNELAKIAHKYNIK